MRHEPEPQLQSDTGGSEPTEFDRFRNLVKKVVSVPKEEFDREAERVKEEAPPEKRGRKKAAE